MSRFTLCSILLLASYVALCTTCLSGKEARPETSQPAMHSRDSLKTKLGLEGTDDVYKFVFCSGGRMILEEMSSSHALCEVALDYVDGRVVGCSTHVYEFGPDGLLSNVGVNSELEDLFVKKGIAFSFVDASPASYSFWLDSTTPFDMIICP